MNKYLLLDSFWRNRDEFPNPGNFVATAREIMSTKARRISSENVPLIELINLQFPYNGTLASEPYIVVQLNDIQRGNANLTATNNTSIRNVATFIVPMNDRTTNPAFFQLSSSMAQNMLFRLDSDIHIELWTRFGAEIVIVDTVPPVAPNPAVQVSALFRIYDSGCSTTITPTISGGTSNRAGD